MKSQSTFQVIYKYHKEIFYGAWLLLNLVQSAGTGLLDDEAYYWVYSKFIDWGYFDHPPMVALLIKAGYAIFPSEFGVRVLFAVMSTITAWLIEKLLPVKDDILFYTIMLSMGLLQVGGIMAVPDTPLLFFTALYFLTYKKLLERPGLKTAILWGVAIVLLLYSKYHGVLLVFFTILSNPRLLIQKHIYIAGIAALLLFSPHLYWQYVHGFPSVQFHLLERSDPEYKASFTLDYILGQILLAGPLAAVLLCWSAFRKKPSGAYERALKYTVAGTYLFFLLATFRGRVEANWTVTVFIPLIVLAHQYMLDRMRLRRWMSILAVITLGLMFFVRVYLMVDLFPNIKFKKREYQANSEWAKAIQQRAGELPVFFTDSYQRPSKYWFFTGEPAFSLNTVDYRRNNFNFWPMEESLMGKKAYAVYQGRKADYYRDSIVTPKGIYLGRTIDHYFSFSRIRIIPQARLVCANGVINTSLKVFTDEGMLQHIRAPYDSLSIWLTVYKDTIIRQIPTNLTLGMIKQSKEVLPAKFNVDLPPGKYIARFSITSCIDNWPTMNSSVIRLRVK
jgi:hypothetical protein